MTRRTVIGAYALGLLGGFALGYWITKDGPQLPQPVPQHRDKSKYITVSKEDEYLFCKSERETFTVHADNVLLVITKVQPSNEVEHGVAGIPVAILYLDDDHVAHIYSKDLPKCYKSNGTNA